MAGGYTSTTPGDLGWLIDELREIQRRLRELETPTGTSMNSLVAQVQAAIANIDTTVSASIAANSYTKAEIDSRDAAVTATANTKVAKSGDTMTGDLFLPNATAAVSGYVVAYWDGTGRISKGASSARFKEQIAQVDPLALGDLFSAPLSTFVMRGDKGRTERVGYIAEDMDRNPETRRFVVYERAVEYDDAGQSIGSSLVRDGEGNPVPESIDFVALLLAQVAQLNARDAERGREIAELRAKISGV